MNGGESIGAPPNYPKSNRNRLKFGQNRNKFKISVRFEFWQKLTYSLALSCTLHFQPLLDCRNSIEQATSVATHSNLFSNNWLQQLESNS